LQPSRRRRRDAIVWRPRLGGALIAGYPIVSIDSAERPIARRTRFSELASRE
jgi:hypothetical protein